MALTLVGLSGFQSGIELAETGINVQKFSCRYYPQYKRFTENHLGQNLGFTIPSQLSREVSFDGHVTGATGIMAATWSTAYVFANDVGTFLATATANSGGFYVDEITEDQDPNDCRKISGKASSHPLCT